MSAAVLIVGLGGLGSPAALSLAAAGVTRLLLADGDGVDSSNLQRQILYRQAQVGQLKVAAAAHTLQALFPPLQLQLYPQRLAGAALEQAVQHAAVVVDGSDNLATRQALNRICWAQRKPWVSAAAQGISAQMLVIDPRQAGAPCFHCSFPWESVADGGCTVSGVLGPVLGAVAHLQALEVLRLLRGEPSPLSHTMLRYHHQQGWRRYTRRVDPSCPVCQ